jgi:hypothetical protein
VALTKVIFGWSRDTIFLICLFSLLIQSTMKHLGNNSNDTQHIILFISFSIDFESEMEKKPNKNCMNEYNNAEGIYAAMLCGWMDVGHIGNQLCILRRVVCLFVMACIFFAQMNNAKFIIFSFASSILRPVICSIQSIKDNCLFSHS